MSKATTLVGDAQSGRVSENDPAARPRKRSFTPEYKLSLLEQLDAMSEPSARAALVRREGLYSSHIAEWRKARDAGALEGLAARGRPRRSPEQVEVGGCDVRTNGSSGNSSARSWPWRSREKHTRS